MEKKVFNPDEWLSVTQKPHTQISNQKPVNHENKNQNHPLPQSLYDNIDNVVQLIDKNGVDITSGYSNWRDIGFALADALGSRGKAFFHRVSRFHSEYDHDQCEQQYEKCLNANGSGITVSTFFYHAKQSGIDIGSSWEKKVEKSQATEPEEELPTIPEKVIETLPDLLKQVSSHANDDKQRDILLLSAITTLSAMLEKVYGLYDNKKVYPNLFLFVVARASSGKGIINHCRQLADPLHEKLRKESLMLKEQYERELAQYNKEKKDNPDAEKPLMPPEKMLFLPANSSATGMLQLLSDNDGKGLIFETEGDTLANTFNTDYGNYSDSFRKAYHHEMVSFFRRTDKEYVEIREPKLSALLTGTNQQVNNLIPDSENGLFSRFMFYHLSKKPQWRSVFSENEYDLDEVFAKLGNDFYELYASLKLGPSKKFILTKEQQKRFNAFFEKCIDRFSALIGDDYIATVYRMGTISFRLMMIFSVLRIMETGEDDSTINCDDQDFENAVAISEVLFDHSQVIFEWLEKQPDQKALKGKKQNFFNQLPREFNRDEYLRVAQTLNIKQKTAEDYIRTFVDKNLLLHPEHNNYQKKDW